VEADRAIERAEKAEQKIKTFELQLLQREQEVTSLTHRNGVLEAELEKTKNRLVGSETT